jgi:hypothetical protein
MHVPALTRVSNDMHMQLSANLDQEPVTYDESGQPLVPASPSSRPLSDHMVEQDEEGETGSYVSGGRSPVGSTYGDAGSCCADSVDGALGEWRNGRRSGAGGNGSENGILMRS